ncbi:MAG TPA: MATE family efflux transporter [Gemmatimonadaceae bacterium]|nr:MATE family efflux transporter [Gemmatimonadaceae bacterium]
MTETTAEQVPVPSSDAAEERPGPARPTGVHDMTTGPITRHLLKTTSFMLVTMVFQTLYFLVDLYWVGRLGTDALAAVGIAGNLTFIVLALTQMLGVGTTTVISHAVGRRDHDQALVLFNQSQVLAMVTGVVFLVFGLLVRMPYCFAMSADANTARLAGEYLMWFIPAMALQFALVAMGSALRATGNFKPGMVVSTATVILNMILAPFLIFGWVTGHPFGVAGAAIASFIAIVVGIIWLMTYFFAPGSFLKFVVADWKPRFDLWKQMLSIGLPAGFEFAMTTVYMFVVYSVTRPFGAAAQAGFAIGMRVVQAGFMPVVALGFSVAPVAGQNFGARLGQRVKDTFKDAAFMAVGAMFVFAIVCNIAPDALVAIFSNDPKVIEVGAEYLRIVSWTFIASGLIFVASSTFQAMGNTIPSFITSTVRISTVAIPSILLASRPGFELHWIWYLSVLSVAAALTVCMLLLRREFRRRLVF